ncbi:response regulator transcription factor [Paenibacillus filicis]|uniref:Response regulator transcription factor n=1 Tax=Paenibacillus gyeongsangnamensis TaxID=3388067 RepID=A0ABT4QJJ6_9BACL|nr:response regulator transcription factor [Paenibacillus filicis]MCZ8517053.1 response regulator transcription factor [Paenibacillus filicis]
MDKTKIVIADDQPLIRDGIAAILSMEEDYNVVAKTGDGLSTIAQVKKHHPQLVIMDIQMPKLDGLQATKEIISEFPDTKILILTTFEDEEYIWEAIRLGASGFLVKGVETEKILSTIQDCLEGRMNYPSSIQMRLVQTLNAAEAAPEQHWDRPKHALSIQERNIISLLKQGKSNQSIATELLLTKGTVKNYLSAIYKKLEVSSRAEAIAYLHKHDR